MMPMSMPERVGDKFRYAMRVRELLIYLIRLCGSLIGNQRPKSVPTLSQKLGPRTSRSVLLRLAPKGG